MTYSKKQGLHFADVPDLWHLIFQGSKAKGFNYKATYYAVKPSMILLKLQV